MPPRHAKALTRERSGTHFAALARSIVYQQLSGKAAATIHGRFEQLFGGETPEPRRLVKMPQPTLRAVGLSERKAEYLRGLAADVVRGAVRPDVLPTLDLAVQTAVKRLYKLRAHPTPQRVATIGAKWAPYRTVASWYLWRVVDDPPQ
jgi:DNA-3-methyladenine glycosylase II